MDHVSFQPPHIWSQGMIPMDYPHPPFTSPPATPMTPMTPALNHHHFPAAAYDVPPPHLYTSAPPPPPPPPPFPSPPDYRLFALCQHLKTYSKVSDSETKRWWEDFMTEFFHDNSTLVVETDLGEGIRKYHLNRQWIPLYFQSLMDNGVTSVHLDLGQCISTYHQSLQELECHNATMETSHTSPHPTKVCINGALVVDFSLEDKPRIITWYFNINDHTEYIPRAMAKPGNESGGGGVQDSITNRGILPSTQKLLLEVGRLENNGYHEATMRNITCSSADGMHRQHWQDMAIINVQSGLEVINGVPLQPEALPPGPGAMILSPGGGIAHSMALMPNSPCLHPNTVGGGGGGGGGAGGSSSSSSIKSKSGRSSTHSNGGSRKRSSPIPNSGTGGSTAKKTHQFMLVAAEAVPLKDADDLPFVPEERRIMRIDNDHHRRHRTTSPQTPTSASKSSPPSNSNTISNGGSVSSNSGSSVSNSSNHVNGVSMSKLCHISNEPGRGLSVDSSMDLGANPNKVMYDSPLQPWTSDGLVAMNQGTPLTTTTR